jgi:propionate CoA-transferase
MQTFAESYNPAYVGEVRAAVDARETAPLDVRKAIARRGAMLLKINSVVNLGVGIPEGVCAVALEEGNPGPDHAHCRGGCDRRRACWWPELRRRR